MAFRPSRKNRKPARRRTFKDPSQPLDFATPAPSTKQLTFMPGPRERQLLDIQKIT